MKSIYVDDQLHTSLKLLSSLEKKALTEIVEECLEMSLRKKLSDLPPDLLEKLAASGGSFAFLSNKQEDIYSNKDGQPLA